MWLTMRLCNAHRPPSSFSPSLCCFSLSLYKVISNRFRKKLNIGKMLWRLKKHRRERVSRDIRSMSDYLAFEREIFTQISHLFAHVPTYILISFSSQSVPVSVCLSIPIPFPFPTFLLSNSTFSNEFSLDWLLATGSFECSFHLAALPHCMATTWQTTGHAAQPHSHTAMQSFSFFISPSTLTGLCTQNVYCNVHFHPSHLSPSVLLHKPRQFMENNYGNGIIVVDSMEGLSFHSSRNFIIVLPPFLFHRYSLHKILCAFFVQRIRRKKREFISKLLISRKKVIVITLPHSH